MHQPKKKPTRALLAQFTVELSQDGKVYLENKSVNPEVFRKTMDEWNQDYEGTLSLTNLLREFKREFEELVNTETTNKKKLLIKKDKKKPHKQHNFLKNISACR